MPPAIQRNHGQNLGLDVVRAGAILAVLFSHTADWFMGAGRHTDTLAAYIGGTGVEVFFSLSGFLIGGILLRTLDRGLTLPALGRFWTRRWMRTLPAYWVLIGGMCWWFDVMDWRSLVFLQNFVPKAQWAPLTPHTWSLVIEEWFYLFVPPMVLVAARLMPRRWAVPAVCALLFGVCTALRTASVLAPNSGLWGDDLGINPFLRLDCAAWGLLAAWIVWRGWTPRRATAVALLTIAVAALIGNGILSELMYTPEVLLPWGFMVWGNSWSIMRLSMTECAAMCALLGLAVLLPSGRGPAAALASLIATLSYALYLVHVPVIYLGRLYGVDDRTGWTARIEVTLLIVAVAAAMRLLVERPVLALRDWLLPDRRPMRPAALASLGPAEPQGGPQGAD